jgi:hypothetical protein
VVRDSATKGRLGGQGQCGQGQAGWSGTVRPGTVCVVRVRLNTRDTLVGHRQSGWSMDKLVGQVKEGGQGKAK